MKTVVIFDAGYDGEIVGVVPMRAREFKQACQSFKFVEIGDKFVNVDKIIFFMDKIEYDKMMALKQKSKNVSVANRKLRITAEDIVNGFDLPKETSFEKSYKEMQAGVFGTIDTTYTSDGTYIGPIKDSLNEMVERVLNDDKEQNASTRF